MFHMHTAFDLREGIEISKFRARRDAFIAHLRDKGLIASAGPITERRPDTPLDTDEARGHRYFTVISFRDRAQSEATWDRIEPRLQPTGTMHRSVYSLVWDPIVNCWEDLP